MGQAAEKRLRLAENSRLKAHVKSGETQLLLTICLGNGKPKRLAFQLVESATSQRLNANADDETELAAKPRWKKKYKGCCAINQQIKK